MFLTIWGISQEQTGTALAIGNPFVIDGIAVGADNVFMILALVITIILLIPFEFLLIEDCVSQL